MAETKSKRGKMQTYQTYLVVDARERAVIPFIETELEDFTYVQRQVNTGDYLVCRGGSAAVLACIERKTHTDFAASFKDGRYENVNKMLELRARTGCQLFFFIEGPAFPAPARRFARIPFSSILAAITRLMVRHGIFIVQTEDERHTAKRICDLMRAYEETPATPAAPAVHAAPATPAQVKTIDLTTSPDGDVVMGGNEDREDREDREDVVATVPEFLTGRIETSDVDAAVNMWARLRGISVVLGRILTREFSVADLVSEKVSVERIRALKTATGRPINKDAVDSLTAVRSGLATQAARIVSGVRNISPALAVHLLAAAKGLKSLCSRDPGALSIMLIPRGAQFVKLGEARAERIYKLLHFRDGDGDCAAAAAQSTTLGGHVLGRGAQPKKAATETPADIPMEDVFDMIFPPDET